MAPAATWKVLPFATETGCPFHSPYQTRIGAASVISGDTIDQAPPEALVQEMVPVPPGMVTFDPAELDVDWVENAVPPAVYPEPVISVPDAEPGEAVEVSLSFIAEAFS